MGDERTPLVATAYGLPALRGVPVHRDLIGSEAGTRRSEIIDRAARMRPQHGRARGELFAGASTRATALGLWDEVSVLQVYLGVKRKARDVCRGWSGGCGLTDEAC